MDAPAPARLLDLTRLVSRAGRMLTGIDRVERAYATCLLQGETPLWGLVQTSLGYLLLDRIGIAAVLAATKSGGWGRPDLLSRLSFRLDPLRQAGQSHARAHAVSRCRRASLGRMLARHLPAGTVYLNTGHSNLSARCLTAIRRVPGARITVMIHDTIPLDFPHYQRPGTVETFAAKLAACRAADLILCPSQVSKSDIERHIGANGPSVVAAPLGLLPVPADPAALPDGLPPHKPYFVTLGTIEPRKNHALLLDVWQALGPDAPALLICGGRGWNNADVFARLDARPANVIERAGLSDGAVSALLARSLGLLFPSHAEGFGLPLFEAVANGTRVICSDLAICREVLADRAVYLPVADRYQWQKTIEAIAADPDLCAPRTDFVPPTWDEHFKTVLRLT